MKEKTDFDSIAVDADPPIRNINFESPEPTRNEGNNINNNVTRSTLLSPPVEDVRFTKYVIKLLQSVVTGNDEAIEFGITEFLKLSIS